ncbi:hypothetical protein BH11MYX1_BH11MYX1_03770 [soil metagenome]
MSESSNRAENQFAMSLSELTNTSEDRHGGPCPTWGISEWANTSEDRTAGPCPTGGMSERVETSEDQRGGPCPTWGAFHAALGEVANACRHTGLPVLPAIVWRSDR